MHEAHALWMLAPRQVALRPEEIGPLAADAVTVRARKSAISHGTEMLVYRGQVDATLALDLPTFAGSVAFPIKYGYALVGEVVAVGANVTSHRCGDHVFVLHPHQSLCQVPAGQAQRIPADVAIESALFAANMETAITIVHDVRPALGEVVVVMGLGIVGLLVSWLLSRMQGITVIAVDPLEWRQAVARQLGLSCVVHPDALPTLVDATTALRGVDAVVEVSGNPLALDSAIALTAVEGRVIVASWYGTKAATLQLGTHFHRKRIQLRATQVGRLSPDLAPRWDFARRMDTVWQLLRALPYQQVMSHSFAFADAAAAYALIDAGHAGVVQVVFDYEV
ncbi:MAG: zinc-dependent alcohol dehydrogenase [Roseiflexaceae bacterium]